MRVKSQVHDENYYTAISIISAQGCSGNNKSTDYSSVGLGKKGKEGKMREKEKAQDVGKERPSKRLRHKRDAECADTYVFHWAEIGMGFPVAWQVSTTFVRPKYQLLS